MSKLRARALSLLLCGVVGCTSVAGGRLVVVGNTVLTRFDAGRRQAAKAAVGESLMPGPAIDRSLLLGKVGIVHFWGSWCGPCRREEPVFVRVATKYRARGVQFLGIDSRRDQRAQAIAFWQEYKTPYPSIYDPASQIAAAWGVKAMPQTFVVAKDGTVAATFYGAADDAKALESVIDEEIAR